VVKELHQKEDFLSIGHLLSSKSAYFLQGYEENENVLSPGFTSYSKEELENFRNILLPYLPNTKIRGF
jgi:pyruvate formate lyase activating enzyme